MKNDKYSKNDIVIIIDGDDYLIKKNTLKIINYYYNLKKCWCTFGESKGNYCEQSRNLWLSCKSIQYFK